VVPTLAVIPAPLHKQPYCRSGCASHGMGRGGLLGPFALRRSRRSISSWMAKISLKLAAVVSFVPKRGGVCSASISCM